ncbi:AfsR/SARP family transcriptional regulator [Actinacidiphila paucisporea]|uniref:DNA-binding transcriptional activator of the SARP family n=1 Tax=Actinacidiphila paucisporea TaxID=310782 RepID=A0A1M7LJ30_9ACTN|nr:BTAD domain-containing putative transcriptional regulator [Actinacidiphila paucisporea]SHM78146.1 DNA-binding transcriptional activator of the SARP family [Actinacidiphila paucisporea]
MRFALLGPLTVQDRHGTDQPAGPPMTRALLAGLLIAPNRPVPLDRIETALWGERAPATARSSLHNHLTRLRRALGEQDRIKAAPQGSLVLRVGDGELDTADFSRRLDAARTARLAGDWAAVTRETQAALGLWRGTPLSEFPRLAALESARVGGWQEARLQAVEWRCDAEMRQGRPDGLLPELLRMTAEFPLREVFHVQLMQTLHRVGQRAGALEAYQRLRRTLIDELGVEPGPAARAAHQQILADTPARRAAAPPAPAAGPPASAGPVHASPNAAAPGPPSALPRDVAAFSGRDVAVRDLLAAVRDGNDPPPAVAVHAVDGMPGVGKTAFAIHVAHRVAEHFPDGQIFFPLHAHTPGTPPVEPADALTGLLLALGEIPERIPADVAARAGLWRSRLAGRRVLVILDDAASSEQIEPLLPGTPGSTVLVTSRRRLVALRDAVPVSLGVLPPRFAAQLLVAKADRPELAAESGAVAELARLCGYLPLALHLTAARLRHHPSWTAADLVADLGAAKDQLTALATEHTSVATAFRSSWADLSADQKALFRRLGTQPAPDVDAYATAALHDVDLATARRLLEELEDHHLLEELTRGRYRMHDLVREYARGLPPDAGDDAAVRRQLDYYLLAGARAVRPFTQFGLHGLPEPGHRAGELPAMDGPMATTAWMRTERLNLRSAAEYAARNGLSVHAVYLPVVMKEFLRTHGYRQEALALYRTAVDTARAAGDRAGQATCLRDISTFQGPEEAEDSLREALALSRALPDPHGEAIALHLLAGIARVTGRCDTAEDAVRRALQLFIDVGDVRGQAEAWTEASRLQKIAGLYQESTASLERALALSVADSNELGQAAALTALGCLVRSTGDYARALLRYRAALALYRSLDHPVGTATVLADLGDLLRQTGAYGEAARCLEESLDLLSRTSGSLLDRVRALTYRSALSRRAGHVVAAEKDLREALALCTHADSAADRTRALARLAEVQEAAGAHTPALADARAAVDLSRTLHDHRGRAEALTVLGAVLLAEGTPAAIAEAGDCHRQALALARAAQAPYEEMLALEALAGSAPADQAAGHLRQALVLARQLVVPDAERIEARLAAR